LGEVVLSRANLLRVSPGKVGFVRKSAALLTVTALALMLGASSVGAAEAPKYVCAEVGCTSGVFIGVRSLVKGMPAAWTIDVCIDSHCARDRVYEPDVVGLRAYGTVSSRSSAVHGLGPYVVSVVVRDRRGKVLLRAERAVRMERYYPNGKGCQGLCFVRGLRLNATRHQLELRQR
jgi:hypothetical protein